MLALLHGAGCVGVIGTPEKGLEGDPDPSGAEPSAGSRGIPGKESSPSGPATPEAVAPFMPASAGRERRTEDPRPWYEFDTDRASAGVRMLTPAELKRAVFDLTGITPDIEALPDPPVLFGMDNDGAHASL